MEVKNMLGVCSHFEDIYTFPIHNYIFFKFNQTNTTSCSYKWVLLSSFHH